MINAVARKAFKDRSINDENQLYVIDSLFDRFGDCTRAEMIKADAIMPVFYKNAKVGDVINSEGDIVNIDKRLITNEYKEYMLSFDEQVQDVDSWYHKDEDLIKVGSVSMFNDHDLFCSHELKFYELDDYVAFTFEKLKIIEAALSKHLPSMVFLVIAGVEISNELLEYYCEVQEPTRLHVGFNATLKKQGDDQGILFQDSLMFFITKSGLISIVHESYTSDSNLIATGQLEEIAQLMNEIQILINYSYFKQNYSYAPSYIPVEKFAQDRDLVFGNGFYYYKDERNISWQVKLGKDVVSDEVNVIQRFYEDGLLKNYMAESVELMKFVENKYDKWCSEHITGITLN